MVTGHLAFYQGPEAEYDRPTGFEGEGELACLRSPASPSDATKSWTLVLQNCAPVGSEKVG